MPALGEKRIDELEREIKQSFDEFNRKVQRDLGRFVQPDGIDFLSLQNGFRRLARNFAIEMTNVLILGAQITANDASRQLSTVVSFDPSEAGAFLAIAGLRDRVMQGLIQQQTEALQEFRRAANAVIPIRTMQQIREGLTLNGRQVRAVNRFRELLEANSVEALTRELRDKRFDSTVRRAATSGDPLSSEQIDKMTAAYVRRQVDFRARTIAATEAVRIANESDMVFFQQLVDRGDVERNELIRRWVTAGDSKVRHSHRVLNGVPRQLGDPWITGNGSVLRFPGDPQGSAADTINCRCFVETKISKKPVQQIIAA